MDFKVNDKIMIINKYFICYGEILELYDINDYRRRGEHFKMKIIEGKYINITQNPGRWTPTYRNKTVYYTGSLKCVYYYTESDYYKALIDGF